MSAKWNYTDKRTAYADGTGTYDEGWYAVSPSGYDCGTGPESGPFATEAEAENEAEKLAEEENEAEKLAEEENKK